jgi:hypothetical protein
MLKLISGLCIVIDDIFIKVFFEGFVDFNDVHELLQGLRVFCF